MMPKILQGATLRNVYVFVLILAIHLVITASFSHTENGQFVVHRSRRNFEVRKGSREHTDNSLKSPTTKGRSTIFATENSTVVYAQIGGTATLPCVVRKFSSGV
ncbi:hypothetical protein ILUMI_13468, partial [Ignelater luminosus]